MSARNSQAKKAPVKRTPSQTASAAKIAELEERVKKLEILVGAMQLVQQNMPQIQQEVINRIVAEGAQTGA